MFVLIYIEVGINSSLMLCIFPHTIKPFNKRERNKKKGNSLSQDTSLISFRAVVLSQSRFCPQRTILAMSGNIFGCHNGTSERGTHYWHLVNRGQRCC